MRGIEIERGPWGLGGANWYRGFFSLQYKRAPSEAEQAPEIPATPPPPDPVSVSFFFRLKPFDLSPTVSLWFTHSRGLDLLYLGGAMVWMFLVVWRITALVA